MNISQNNSVRSHFKKYSILTGPVIVQTPQAVDTSSLLETLEKRLNSNTRLEASSFDLRIWLLESGQEAEDLSRPEILHRLRKKIKADYILQPLVKSVKGKLVLAYRLISALDGTLLGQGQTLLNPTQIAKQPPRPKTQTPELSAQNIQRSVILHFFRATKGSHSDYILIKIQTKRMT